MLLVEDEKKVSELVARALRAERYAVDVADDGTRGWELASSYDYDLVILDLMLPGIPGEELLRRIRNKDQQVPILILTARDATEEKVHNFDSPEADYRTKPMDGTVVITGVAAPMGLEPVGRRSVTRVADLEVDRARSSASRRQAHELTPKEYALLEYLAANPGVFCAIIEASGTRALRTHQYRGRVRAPPARGSHDPFPVKLIRTVRGVGYGLAGPQE
jgi:DNA-binding response OmpR family regulator